eukprot:CAMPEP_0201514708 /NCGR_PEP_ID=MMETSP0161_2-20130828/6473_1 /ASSEMBLY_ACC=CAM_ASM_000251 /TAXON_ID=180227 /ORGANISM="Neoparamoeba aestuarina, Strain SoJaBio B1-5/56/2" /LENGTH=210 /DNA_ID=CAMNT_0047911337 /DNA_START=55 /DNA_END=687 /DNA_ORIENTATION=-
MSSSRPKHHKITLLGDIGVGKTAHVIQLCSNHFVEEYDPTIEDSYRKRVVVDNESLLLELLDTCYCAEYQAMQDSWVSDSEAFMLVYSITDRTSYEGLEKFVNQIFRYKEFRKSFVPICLVGNKCDLEDDRQVGTEEGNMAAQDLGALFFETSAKDRINIEESYYDLVRLIRQQNPSRNSKGEETKRPSPPPQRMPQFEGRGISVKRARH